MSPERFIAIIIFSALNLFTWIAFLVGLFIDKTTLFAGEEHRSPYEKGLLVVGFSTIGCVFTIVFIVAGLMAFGLINE